MAEQPVITPLPAATVTLVRDTERGLEVLMLQRNFSSGFMPGMHVFPGGALDESDQSAEWHALCVGLDDRAASRTLGIERGGLAYWIAAIRESFEEAGVLLACDAQGGLVSLVDRAVAGRFHAHRKSVDTGKRSLSAVLAAEGLWLATDRLLYFAHWITPVGAPRRYDTRFFMAVAPERQEASHDNLEAIAHAWLRPSEALDRHARGELKMRFPTIKTLEQFAAYASTQALIAALTAHREVPVIQPRLTRDGASLLPGEAGYEEACEGQGKWKI